MTVTMADIVSNKQVAELVTSATRTIHRRYRRYITWNDLSQEQWTWLCANPDRAMELFDQSEVWLLLRLRTIAERYARREKAIKSGYKVEDECFYSLARIDELLPDALDPKATSPQTGPADTPTSRPDTWGDWETSVVDVRRACAVIPGPAYAVIAQRHVQGKQVDPDVYRNALRAIQRALGGPRPKAPT